MNVIPKTAEQVAEKAGKKVVSVTKHAISTTVDTATHPTAVIKRVQHTNNTSEGTNMGTQDVHKHHHQDTKHTAAATTTMPLPPTRNKLNVERTKHNIATHTQQHTPQPQSSSDTLFSISNQSTTFLLTIYTAILSIYHAYTHKSDILQNAFPLSVVTPLVVVAFLMGYMLDKLLILFSDNDVGQDYNIESGRRTVRRANGKRRFSNLSIQARRGGMIHGGNGTEKGGVYVGDVKPENENIDESNRTDESTQTDTDDTEEESSVYFSRTREFFKPGWKRKKIKKKYEKYVKELNHYGGVNSERSKESSNSSAGSKREMTAQFFTNLNPMKRGDVKEWEVKLKAPFRESPLMDHLFTYEDFGRQSTQRREEHVIKKEHVTTKSHKEETMVEEYVVVSEEEEEDTALGHAQLNNIRASQLAKYEEKKTHWIDPLCELRGMDLFLTDDPEESVWKQPLLNQNGLRNAPTLLFNMMMPFGNMNAYFQLPSWVDSLDNIPPEKEDDPNDVKALKRFLLGDNDYRNARAKVIPYVVDGPLAIRVIKPKPLEVDLWGPRHPSKWEDVPKSVDPKTGKVNHVVLECDIDLLANKTIRKIINIVRPHIGSIVADLALIVSAPKHSEIEEPSCCLGLWRIDRVDFEQCAVVPEKTIHEAARELTDVLSTIMKDEDRMEFHVKEDP